jgi:hypothetical protein
MLHASQRKFKKFISRTILGNRPLSFGPASGGTPLKWPKESGRLPTTEKKLGKTVFCVETRRVF